MELLPAPVESVQFQEETPTQEKWELSELKPKHQQVASLFAQGFKNIEIAAIVGVTPEYVSMLIKQPLVRQEIARICSIAETRMEALFDKAVDTVAEVMVNGNNKEKLQAVRLQLEATKRIGRGDPAGRDTGENIDRLTLLANRLLQLQAGVRQGNTYENGEAV